MSRDWHAWYGAYDDPASSLSRRLAVVRRELAAVLADRPDGPMRLLSLCAGDGRDTLPVLAAAPVPVSAVLVELDPELAQTARDGAAAHGLDVEVRTGDAGLVSTWRDVVPVDVLMLCGVLGNVTAEDTRRTLAGAASMVRAGGTLIWTRAGDEADDARAQLLGAGWSERAYVRPDDASYRVGVHTLDREAPATPADRLFAFVP